MPTSECLCRNCEKSVEVALTITERARAEVPCANCQSEKGPRELTVSTVKTSRKG